MSHRFPLLIPGSSVQACYTSITVQGCRNDSAGEQDTDKERCSHGTSPSRWRRGGRDVPRMAFINATCHNQKSESREVRSKYSMSAGRIPCYNVSCGERWGSRVRARMKDGFVLSISRAAGLPVVVIGLDGRDHGCGLRSAFRREPGPLQLPWPLREPQGFTRRVPYLCQQGERLRPVRLGERRLPLSSESEKLH